MQAMIPRCFTMAALLLLSTAAFAQIAPRSGDVSGNVGWTSLVGVNGNRHANFGSAGGYNVTQDLAAAFEYNYLPTGFHYGVSTDFQLLAGRSAFH